MNRNKIKSIVASLVIVTSIFTNSIVNVSAATNVTSDTSSSTTNVISSDSQDASDEHAVKVNIDDNGTLTYQEPVSATTAATEDKAFSWKNATVYFAITDRFENGDKTNDHSYGRGLDADGKAVAGYETNTGYFHGGDLKGMTNKLSEGYFDDLGVNAIWITAPYEQIHGALSSGGFKHYAYHGYYALDFTTVDANMGTAAELETFIDTAHEHGIRIIFDIVMNHAGYANPVDANEFGYGKLAADWKSIYYSAEANLKWYNDYVEEAAANGSKGMMDPKGDYVTTWWGPQWVRAVTNRFSGYTGVEAGGIDTCLQGLPDFKTEGTTDPGIPPILKTKWTKEGTYAAKSKSLTDYFASSGQQPRVTTYLVKWLTDWVREYGVDGFRCDTAKHIETKEWKVLKDEGVKALKEWRTKNPTKAGAKWTDDFWMTGENFDQGAGANEFNKIGGFDSMINFGFPKDGSVGANLEGTYSGYAGIVASGANNPLSYLSSHDKGLARGNMIGEGTALLLAPGAIQIFYGDETNRQNGPASTDKDQPCRSSMNWSDITDASSAQSKVLAHWQKIGTFRKNHLAIGAGAHKQLSAAPYTFSRVYTAGDVTDKVVVSLPGKAGAVDVTVGDTFDDGTTVIDGYTGESYVVTGGKVSVTAGDNGVVLLSGDANAPKTAQVSVSPGTKSYTTDTLDLKLSMANTLKATYSIDKSEPVAYENGKTITIGAGLAIGTETTVTVTTTDADLKEVTKTYTYTKEEAPVIDPATLTRIYFKKPATWGETVNAYVFTTGGTTSAVKWPGSPMTKEADGTYSYEVPEGFKDGYVVFNSGTNQDPAKGNDIKLELGKVYNAGTWEDIAVKTPLSAGLTADKVSPQKTGTAVKLTATGKGGSGTYSSYVFTVNDGTTDTTIDSTGGVATWTPKKEGKYTIKVTVTDSDKATTTKTLSYTISDLVIAPPTGTPTGTPGGTTTQKDTTTPGGTTTQKDTTTPGGTTTKPTTPTPDGSTKTPDGGTKTPDNTTTPGDVKTIKSLVLSASTLKVELGKSIVLRGTTDKVDSEIKYSFGDYKAVDGTFKNWKSLTGDQFVKENSYTWTPTEAGTYKVYAIATYLGGTQYQSQPIIIEVSPKATNVDTGTVGPGTGTAKPGDTADSNSMAKVAVMMTIAGGIIALGFRRKKITE